MSDVAPNQDSLPQLLHRLNTEGVTVDALEAWRPRALAALMLKTESGAVYVIEPREGQASLVSRLAEVGPRVDYDGPRVTTTIFRHEGNPDRDLKTGEKVDIMGLSRISDEFDPDSLYTTSILKEIVYLEPAPNQQP